MNVLKQLQSIFADALKDLVDDPTPYVEMVRPAQDAKFGDYQANCAMPLTKVLGKKNPREVAQMIIDQLPTGEMLQEPEIAGPGFINLRLQSEWLANQVQSMAGDERLGVDLPKKAKTIVIDYSSPNVAKPMHVGHLRSTIIGDAIARLLRFLGHKVIADNHLGDWGKQFGILLYGYKNHLDKAAFEESPIDEMVRLYKHVNSLCSTDEEVNAAAQEETVKLHEGDEENRALWQQLMVHCHASINEIYDRLDIHFDCTLGESFYNDQLDEVLEDLKQKGLTEESEGATVITPGEDFPSPFIVQSSQGAYTYATTDLATIKYRMNEWSPDTILYVVDFRQSQHFGQLFDSAKKWGYEDVHLEHVSFGAILGKNRKPLKTREGDNVGLADLLDEARDRAKQIYEESSANQEDAVAVKDVERVWEIVGIGAVKYADLSQNRTTDYVFDWEKMMAMDGNTATYMQYAYARNRSIFRKGEESSEDYRTNPPCPTLEQSAERHLAAQLVRFQEVLEHSAEELKPNLITGYLWDVAKAYSGFFQNCPVLKAESPEVRKSRLLLCDVTGRVIHQALQLLGIETVERM